ncbi:alpha/beta fold hydrolase [Salinisphaera sp.]|uniref:alpha/beta fold hydrolase n=1 Tax=Salinisphaera sp. TaxID=1914330 RepID=UPI002D792D78|nr:alpha/beta fold hydrolase [Salinisphaera sp.]HET7313953.1 alpha/beta fold hydrolase [Salinisphaera sp.]
MADADKSGLPAPSGGFISDAVAEQLDRETAARWGQIARGLDVRRIALAYVHWLTHMGMAPGKVAQLSELWFRQYAQLGGFAMRSLLHTEAARAIEPDPDDRRFTDAGWRQLPFSLIEQHYLLRRYWWTQATANVSGLSDRNENLVRFYTRLAVDSVSPYNFPLTNPEVWRATWEANGFNLLRGAGHLVRDIDRYRKGRRPKSLEDFKVGVNLATTEGKVVYRNRLIELIQYTPTTARVHPEPVLIVPAWIMKYYILDLSEGKSMVRYLLDQGHTVFIISWKNPDRTDRDLDMDDYRRLGPLAALEAVNTRVPERKIHAMGYCVGGTLMAITAAAMARDGDDRLATLSLLAAQTDFTEPGELRLFINDSQLSWLDGLMWKQGYLDKTKMAGAFKLLRANDLVWQPLINNYWLGQDQPGIGLMAWNADATRMPYRMHAEYLNRLYLHNQLADGQYEVEGRPIALRDIEVPIFSVGTERDHIAPWRSVYKIELLAEPRELTFLLTSGGHNAGIVTPPGHPRRHYRMFTRQRREHFLSADEWIARTAPVKGSWWPAWQNWLKSYSGNKVEPPAIGEALSDAPGTYVFQQ